MLQRAWPNWVQSTKNILLEMLLGKWFISNKVVNTVVDISFYFKNQSFTESL